MRPSFSSRRRQAGLSLLEVLLAVGLTLFIGALAIDAVRSTGETRQAEAAGEQLKGVGSAFNTYLSMRYDKIVTLTNVGGSCPDINNTSDPTMRGDGNDPGPRCCTGNPTDANGALCTINSDTLRRSGLLPNSFSGYNSYGARYVYNIRVIANAPNFIVDGVVFTDTPYITTGTTPRYDLLGTAMQVAGADSGMTRSVANRMEGLNGAWSEASFVAINQLGLLGYRAGYGTSGYAAYLRLDGSTAMTGDLLLGPDSSTRHSILNVQDVGAQTAHLTGNGVDSNAALTLSNKGSPVTEFAPITTGGTDVGGLAIRNAVGVDITNMSGGWGSLKSGAITTQGDITANGNVTTTGTVQAGSLVSTGNITTNGGDVQIGNGHHLTLSNAGGNTGGWYVDDSAWLRANNDGNVMTAGQMRGGQLLADNLLQVGGTAVPNTACTNTGAYVSVAKSSAGNELLQCRNSLWTTLGTSTVEVTGGTTAGTGTSATAVCPTGTAVTGGGYRLVTYAPVYPNSASNAPDISKASGNGWFIFSGAAVGNSVFQAYAYCAQ